MIESAPMGPTALALATTAAATALSAWGSYALVLIALGWMLWRSHQDRASLKQENLDLREEIKSLNDKRLEDAQKLIRVTETNTATTTARSEGDHAFQGLVRRLTEEIADLGDQIRSLPRRPSR